MSKTNSKCNDTHTSAFCILCPSLKNDCAIQFKDLTGSIGIVITEKGGENNSISQILFQDI